MATRTKKAQSSGSPVGDDILHGLHELVDTLKAGHKLEDHFKVRIVEISEPTSHSAKTVKALRERLGVSQAAFAKLVGVSTVLAQSWEQGVRTPSRLVGRLLDTIAVDPVAWLATVRKVRGRAG